MNYAHSLKRKAIKQKTYRMKQKLLLLKFVLLITVWIGSASITQATAADGEDDEPETTQLLTGVATGCDNLFFGIKESGTNNISLYINQDCEESLPANITINPTAIAEGVTYNITGIYNLANCTTLQSITLPNSITSIAQNAFSDCSNLKQIIVKGSVTLEDSVFNNCSNLQTLEIDGIGTFGEYSLSGCSSLKTVTLKGNTSIDKWAFRECKNLETINIPNVTTLGEGAFYNCQSLKTFNLEKITSIDDFAFYGCKNLNQEVKFNQELTKIGKGAFEGCEKLHGNLSIPNKVEQIGATAFKKCSALNGTLTLGTALKSIGKGAFILTNLEGNIKLPATLEEIGEGAFQWSKLGENQDLVLPASVKTIGPLAFQKKDGQTEWRSITFEKGSMLESLGKKRQMEYTQKKQDNTVETIKCETAGDIFSGISTYIDLTNCTKLKQTEDPYGYFFERSGKKEKTELNSEKQKTKIYWPIFRNVHPWVLIYLPPQIKVEKKEGEKTHPVNFVSNGTCKDLRVYEHHGFKAIHKFTAETATYVECDDINQFTDLEKEYNVHEPRKFWGSKCYTLCLPYPVKVKRDGFTDAKAYHLRKQFWGKNGEREIYQFVSFDDNETIPANTPFLLYGVNSKEKLPLLQCMQNVEVPITPDIKDMSELKEDLRYYGTTLPISFRKIKDEYSKNNQEVYLLNYQDKTWYPVRNNEKAKIPPFRCFIQTGNQQATAKFAVLMENINEKETSHINKQVLDNIKNNIHTFYTIDGKAMGNNFNLLPKGAIYIINGRKIYKF